MDLNRNVATLNQPATRRNAFIREKPSGMTLQEIGLTAEMTGTCPTGGALFWSGAANISRIYTKGPARGLYGSLRKGRPGVLRSGPWRDVLTVKKG